MTGWNLQIRRNKQVSHHMVSPSCVLQPCVVQDETSDRIVCRRGGKRRDALCCAPTSRVSPVCPSGMMWVEFCILTKAKLGVPFPRAQHEVSAKKEAILIPPLWQAIGRYATLLISKLNGLSFGLTIWSVLHMHSIHVTLKMNLLAKSTVTEVAWEWSLLAVYQPLVFVQQCLQGVDILYH